MRRSTEQGKTHLENESVSFGSIAIELPAPSRIPQMPLIERAEILNKALAAWTPYGNRPPLHFRLVGPPGVGKNAIVYELARIMKKDLYIINGHAELNAEDIACTVRPTRENTFKYVGSPLMAGLYRGGIVFFDEIGKATPSALDPLSSVVDDRRVLYSVLAGVQVYAHPDFLFCAALQDSEAHCLPTFLDERTCPAIHVGYPSVAEIEKILCAHFPESTRLWTETFVEEFGKCYPVSSRKAINLMGYAYRTVRKRGIDPCALSKKQIQVLLLDLKTDLDLGKSVNREISPETGGNNDLHAAVNSDRGMVH